MKNRKEEIPLRFVTVCQSYYVQCAAMDKISYTKTYFKLLGYRSLEIVSTDAHPDFFQEIICS